MSSARIRNFGLMDLIETNGKRFTSILSAVINFVRFSDSVRVDVQQQAEELVCPRDRTSD